MTEIYMITTNVTNFRKGLTNLIKQTIHSNEPIHITTKEGNAVMISEDEYNGLIETLYLTSIPGMREKLTEGLDTPLDETVSEEEVLW